MPHSLDGRIALVAGASRGLGKAIALALGAAGAIVYVTGRSSRSSGHQLSGSVEDTATEIAIRGGIGVGLQCDHRDDRQVELVFDRVAADYGRLDILVNAMYPTSTLPQDLPRSLSGKIPVCPSFWALPIGYWDDLYLTSLRASYVCDCHAARLMIVRRRGLIVHLSSGGAKRYWFNVPYSSEKSSVERLITLIGHDLRPYDVTTIALRPPLSLTEPVERALSNPKRLNEHGYSPDLTGEVVAALAADPAASAFTGTARDVLELAERYGLSIVPGIEDSDMSRGSRDQKARPSDEEARA